MQEGMDSSNQGKEESKDQRRAKIMARIHERQRQQRQVQISPSSTEEKNENPELPQKFSTPVDQDLYSQLLWNRNSALFDQIMQEQHPQVRLIYAKLLIKRRYCRFYIRRALMRGR